MRKIKRDSFLTLLKKKKIIFLCIMYFLQCFFSSISATASKDDDDVILLFIERIFHKTILSIVPNFQKYIFTCFTPGNFHFSPTNQTKKFFIFIFIDLQKKKTHFPRCSDDYSVTLYCCSLNTSIETIFPSSVFHSQEKKKQQQRNNKKIRINKRK